MSLPSGFKIDMRRVYSPAVRDALDRLHATQVYNDPTALIVWCDGFLPSRDFLNIYPHQRLNKIPGMEILCSKNTFFQALSRMKTLYPGFYNFFPTTFQLPFQFSEFQREHLRLSAEYSKKFKGSTPPRLLFCTWILKPRSGCCGSGIRLIQNSFNVLNLTQPAIIQRYVSPFLIDGYKFDFRFYVLISALQPLSVYIYNEGLARFCTHLYTAPTPETLSDRFCHLTNTAVNIANIEKQRPILELASAILKRVTEIDARGHTLWERIREVVMLSIVAQYPGILQNVGIMVPDVNCEGFAPPQKNIDNIHRYFHLLGIDVMINNKCEPIILELNDRPSMCMMDDLEHELKAKVVFDTLNVVSADGEDVGKVRLGGWEKLLPMERGVGGYGLHTIIERECKGALAEPNRLVLKRLGYVPSASYSRGSKRIVVALPPLHQ
jgi:hypothetical protein